MNNYILTIALIISLINGQALQGSWQEGSQKLVSFLAGAQIAALPMELMVFIFSKKELLDEKKLLSLAAAKKSLEATDIAPFCGTKVVVSEKEFLALSAVAAASIAAFMLDSKYKHQLIYQNARLAGIISIACIVAGSILTVFAEKPEDISERDQLVRSILTQAFGLAPFFLFAVDYHSLKNGFKSEQLPTISPESTSSVV